MDKRLKWRLFLILGVVAVCVLASRPLTERDVRQFLKTEAVNQDDSFRALLSAMEKEYDRAAKKVPVSGIDLLKEKTRDLNLDLARYFPDRGVDNEAVLKYINRETRGKLNLGLDLQGGMHVVLEVDDHELLRKRAENADEPFIAFMDAVKEESRGSVKTSLEVLVARARATGFDLVKYYRKYYTEKYSLDEGKIKNNEDIYVYFREDIETANRGALEILRNRVDKFGVSEPDIQKQGKGELLIQMPGVRDPEKTLELIQGQAYLEFKLVDDNKEALAKAIRENKAPPGFELKVYEKAGRDNRMIEEKILVRERPELTGENLVTAYPGTRSDTREPIVHFKFDHKGARLFSRLTKQYNAEENPPGRQLAILLDGKVLSAPLIRTHIPQGEGYVEGNFTRDEAMILSSQLSAGAYPAPLRVKEKRTVGPTLGEDSIRQGLRAGLAGLIVVVIFMAVYYRLAGLVADIALLLNMGIIVAVLCLLPELLGVKATLTLPGIAGIILTIGMSVDANVLIYERIREELEAGKRLIRAIAAGYQKSFLVIFDSNLTTIIAALVLLNPFNFAWLPTSGPVKGFAVTLTIGIVASMFTALVVTRAIFDLFCLTPRFQRLRMMRMMAHPNYDFVGKWKRMTAISLVVIVAGVVCFALRGNANFGIDFTGGILIQRQFTREVPLEKVRGLLKTLGLGDSSVQSYGGGKGIIIRASADQPENIDRALRETFRDEIDPVVFEQRTEMVGPKVGNRLKIQALLGIAVALLAMMAYVWHRFGSIAFAIGGVLSLAHDVLITLAFCTGFFILPLRQLNISTVAALLTIIGYSINDTIVLFSRLRENLKIRKGEPLEKIINVSINETLSRTILTSLVTLLAVLMLFFFGGEVINDFSFALLIGLVSGSYSTIYIASPVLLLMHRKVRLK